MSAASNPVAVTGEVHTETDGPGQTGKADRNLQHVVAGESVSIPLIPSGGVFEGQVSVQGKTRIDGTVRGTLRGTGLLELGPASCVEGEIECEDVRSEGVIVGPVVAHRRAELRAGAALQGDLTAPVVVVADSATWTGEAKVGQ